MQPPRVGPTSQGGPARRPPGDPQFDADRLGGGFDHDRKGHSSLAVFAVPCRLDREVTPVGQRRGKLQTVFAPTGSRSCVKTERGRAVRPVSQSGSRLVAVDLVIQKAAQLAAPAWMLQLAQGLGLDLADALAGHAELLADLLQRVVGVHADAEAHAKYALLARGK